MSETVKLDPDTVIVVESIAEGFRLHFVDTVSQERWCFELDDDLVDVLARQLATAMVRRTEEPAP